MPFKSQAQRRKFAELLVKGEISEATFEEWNHETGSAKLPEYANGGRAAKGNKKVKSRSRTKSQSKTKTTSKSKPSGESRKRK